MLREDDKKAETILKWSQESQVDMIRHVVDF